MVTVIVVFKMENAAHSISFETIQNFNGNEKPNTLTHTHTHTNAERKIDFMASTMEMHSQSVPRDVSD